MICFKKANHNILKTAYTTPPPTLHCGMCSFLRQVLHRTFTNTNQTCHFIILFVFVCVCVCVRVCVCGRGVIINQLYECMLFCLLDLKYNLNMYFVPQMKIMFTLCTSWDFLLNNRITPIIAHFFNQMKTTRSLAPS